MPPKEPSRIRPPARAVLLALAVGAVPALAQNADPPLAQGGAPRSIVPPIILAPRPPPPDRPTAPPQEPGPAPVDSVVGPDIGPAPLAPIPELGAPAQSDADSMPEPAVEAVPMRRFNPAASAVVVGDLGDLEGPIAGTLDASEGLAVPIARSTRFD
jgi:hypothetical protein